MNIEAKPLHDDNSKPAIFQHDLIAVMSLNICPAFEIHTFGTIYWLLIAVTNEFNDNNYLIW